METLNKYLESIFTDNIWFELATLFSILVFLFVIGKIIGFFIKKISKKKLIADKPQYAAFLNAIAKSMTFVLISTGFMIGISIIEFPEKTDTILSTVAQVLLTLSIGYFVFYLVDVPSIWFESLLSKSDKGVNKMFLPVIKKSLGVLVIILVIMQMIQILSNKPIASIVAGLGIGGLAVALAAQDTFKHFFGSFVLAGDKPFEIGDRVVIDGHDGPVESIGLRSTRIRTLDGHLITIPNGELANKTIQNIGKRPYIRRLANITITYDTPGEKIYRAVVILKEILENHEGMDPELPPRVYFNDLNSDSLNILMIYWYHPPDYWRYMEFTEKVNHEIMRRFNEEGIDFAFPSQTVYLAGDKNRPLDVGIKNQKDLP
jgi:MscS family membrane protein